MNREEILVKLHNIDIGANVIAETFDMGLQYAYVTPKGYGDVLGTIREWPVFCLNNVNSDYLQILKAKLINKSLTENDLYGSDFLGLYKSVTQNGIFNSELLEINKFYEKLIKVDTVEDNRLYVICDSSSEELKINFFGNYKDLEQGFVKDYVLDINDWEACSDEELLDWLDYIEDNKLTSILVLSIENEEL